MGRNAQVRRDRKHAAHAAPVERTRCETNTLRRLRLKMKAVTTLSQFEEILAGGAEETRVARRRLLEPMLRDNLPCCGPGALAEKLGQDLLAGQHTLYCPTRKKVLLAGQAPVPVRRPTLAIVRGA